MSGGILQGKRVLITQADAFMGPVLCQVFVEQGASVMANTQSLIDPRTPSAVVTAAGLMDVLFRGPGFPGLRRLGSALMGLTVDQSGMRRF